MPLMKWGNEEANVPAEDVEYYRSKGATLVEAAPPVGAAESRITPQMESRVPLPGLLPGMRSPGGSDQRVADAPYRVPAQGNIPEHLDPSAGINPLAAWSLPAAEVLVPALAAKLGGGIAGLAKAPFLRRLPGASNVRGLAADAQEVFGGAGSRAATRPTIPPNATAVPAPVGWTQGAPVGAAASRVARPALEVVESAAPKGMTKVAGHIRNLPGKIGPKVEGEKDIIDGLKWIKDKQPVKLQAAAAKKWINEKVPEELRAHALAEAKRLIGGL